MEGSDSRNRPGRPPIALKQSEVSSVITAPCTCWAARRHFSLAISSGSPWSSGRSTALASRVNGSALPLARMARTCSEQSLLGMHVVRCSLLACCSQGSGNKRLQGLMATRNVAFCSPKYAPHLLFFLLVSCHEDYCLWCHGVPLCIAYSPAVR